MMFRRALLALALAAPLAAQQVAVLPDSLVLHPGDTARVVATVRGAPDSLLAYTGSNAAIFTAHRDGRVTARALGCAWSRVSAGTWARAQVRVCVVPRPVTPPPPPPDTTPVPPTPTLLFRADWPVAGTALEAILSGAWDRNLASIAGLAAVPTDGLDFPMPHALRVTALDARDGYALLRTAALPPLAVGRSRWYRHYARYVFSDAVTDNQTHPIQDGGAGSQINWAWSLRLAGPGRYTYGLKLHTNNPWCLAEFTPPTLLKGQTYRFEHQIERVSETQFRMAVRVYDATGALVLSDADFVGNNCTTTLADRPLLLFNNPANLNGLNAGLNGLSGLVGDMVYGYQAGFAVSDAGWIGAWTP